MHRAPPGRFRRRTRRSPHPSTGSRARWSAGAPPPRSRSPRSPRSSSPRSSCRGSTSRAPRRLRSSSGRPPAPRRTSSTPYQREEALARARKLGTIAGLGGRGAPAVRLRRPRRGAPLRSASASRARGPGSRRRFSVTAHGMLPVWLSGLLAIPAAVARAPIPPGEVPRLLPTSLARVRAGRAAAARRRALLARPLHAVGGRPRRARHGARARAPRAAARSPSPSSSSSPTSRS